MKQFEIDAAGNLTITESSDEADERGNPLVTVRTISAEQLAKHRRDDAFEASIPAAIKKKLPARAT